MSASELPDGLVAVVKADCPTCQLVVPALEQIMGRTALTVVTQDSPTWPPGFAASYDEDLDHSWRLQTDTTPTLYRIEDGAVTASAVGGIVSGADARRPDTFALPGGN